MLIEFYLLNIFEAFLTYTYICMYVCTIYRHTLNIYWIYGMYIRHCFAASFYRHIQLYIIKYVSTKSFPYPLEVIFMLTCNFVVVFSNSDTHERKHLDTLLIKFSVISAAVTQSYNHTLNTTSRPPICPILRRSPCMLARSTAHLLCGSGYPVYPIPYVSCVASIITLLLLLTSVFLLLLKFVVYLQAQFDLRELLTCSSSLASIHYNEQQQQQQQQYQAVPRRMHSFVRVFVMFLRTISVVSEPNHQMIHAIKC